MERAQKINAHILDNKAHEKIRRFDDFARTLNAAGAHHKARDGFESLERWLHAAQSAALGQDFEGTIRFLQTWLKQIGPNYSRYYRALAHVQLGDACKKKGELRQGNTELDEDYKNLVRVLTA